MFQKIKQIQQGIKFIVYDYYKLIKTIGSGAYGVVCSAIDQRTGQKVAIKKIQDTFKDPIDAKRVLREIKLLNFFKHKNIIQIIDLVRPDFCTGYQDIYLILEFMDTDLQKIIYSAQQITQKMTKYLMWQLLNGIYYMHSANVIHRDLKPNNILLQKNCTLKIADLNLARKFENIEYITDYVVTRWYRAPEILISNQNYTQAIDIWSAGCIFAEIMGKCPIFEGKDFLNQLDRIIAILGTPDLTKLSYQVQEYSAKYITQLQFKKPESFFEIFKNQDPLAIDLLCKMLVFDFQDRWTAEQCLYHEYFSEYDKSQIIKCEDVFDWKFDEILPKVNLIEKAIYDEGCKFHPFEEDATEQEFQQFFQQQLKQGKNEQDNSQENRQKIISFGMDIENEN
ncbi:protein kinase domain protein [Ichthyophthirius multifiliis]|uniref:Mitogen-activated protein kinase n=1 Tax=Ichthyophthirius multifiliis TaxID=5932 RepID=G0R0K4_ICHMU|nr:protein kinase domain protein [Ichthyophthirius multifiliis]EGR28990.1 protein kinase domain protein [Ichthyophthirius multifiliis]|eukprot:XP_004030226.1 protein kinase domain protein [Ichthyophthirius multifiliis]